MKAITRMVRLFGKLTDEEKEILSKLISKDPVKKDTDSFNNYNHKGTVKELLDFYGHIA